MRVDVAPLDSSDEPDPHGLVMSLEHAYYQRDVESLRRIAQRAELEIQRLREAAKREPR